MYVWLPIIKTNTDNTGEGIKRKRGIYYVMVRDQTIRHGTTTTRIPQARHNDSDSDSLDMEGE